MYFSISFLLIYQKPVTFAIKNLKLCKDIYSWKFSKRDFSKSINLLYSLIINVNKFCGQNGCNHGLCCILMFLESEFITDIYLRLSAITLCHPFFPFFLIMSTIFPIKFEYTYCKKEFNATSYTHSLSRQWIKLFCILFKNNWL